jgi:hypothetical protein
LDIQDIALANQDQIKGVLLMDFARIIRANKGLPWEEYVTGDDMELIQGKIMPSTWYPFDVLARIGYAVFMLVGKGDLKNAWSFGAFAMQDTFHKVYENVLFQENNPESLLKKFIVLRKQFIRFHDPEFETLKLEVSGPGRARIIFKLPEVNRYIEPYTHQLAGGFEKLLELAGAGDVSVNVNKIQSETEPASEIELAWSQPDT